MSPALGKLLAQTKIGNKAVVKFAPAGIDFAQAPGRGAIFGQSDKSSLIRSHEGCGDASGPALKRQASEGALGIAINVTNQADIITADIEQQRCCHQVGFAYEKIFVLIKGLEPSPISRLILRVVVLEQRAHIFAGETPCQQVGHEITGERTKIEPRTVERIDESGRITNRGPTIAANLFAPIRQR